MAECKGSSTKQLKQCLGFWDLMGASVGQIIGAGIMTLLGAACLLYTSKKRTDPADDRCINGFLCYFHSVHAGYETVSYTHLNVGS